MAVAFSTGGSGYTRSDFMISDAAIPARVEEEAKADQKEQLIKQVEEFSAELETVCRQGAQAFEISVRKRYIVTLQQEIHAKDTSAARKQEEINKQLGVVVEATKDVRTLEKLEEKQLEDYKAAANKENEQFIEEFVSGQSIRAAQTQSV